MDEPVLRTVRFAPRGPLDAHTADALRQTLLAALAEPDVGRVAVDLHEVGFVDSTGLGALIAVRTAALARAVQFVLARPPAQLVRLMAMTATYAQFRWDDGRAAGASAPTAPGHPPRDEDNRTTTKESTR